MGEMNWGASAGPKGSGWKGTGMISARDGHQCTDVADPREGAVLPALKVWYLKA